MSEQLKIDPYGFREYDARWLYEESINKFGITNLGKGLGTQIINHTKKNNPKYIKFYFQSLKPIHCQACNRTYLNKYQFCRHLKTNKHDKNKFLLNNKKELI